MNRSWHTLTVLVADELLKEAVIGEFSAGPIDGVWERPAAGGYQEVVLYFPKGGLPPLAEARVRRIFERNGLGPPEFRIGEEAEADWTREWRKGFSSFPIGQRFRVVPGWEEPPDPDSRIALRIDPGMAFGTGTHETTQMVLEALEVLGRQSPVLDLGTGSGILAIAARKLGANPVVACDTDPDAVAVARSNFVKNGVGPGLFVGSLDAVATGSVRLVLANLTAEAIAANLGDVARVLLPGGHAIFSGILGTQAGGLEPAMGDRGFVQENRTERGEWVSYRVRTGGH